MIVCFAKSVYKGRHWINIWYISIRLAQNLSSNKVRPNPGQSRPVQACHAYRIAYHISYHNALHETILEGASHRDQSGRAKELVHWHI